MTSLWGWGEAGAEGLRGSTARSSEASAGLAGDLSASSRGRGAFVDPPARRNRVWQTDFSGLETAGAGVRQLGGRVGHACKWRWPARGRPRRPGATPSGRLRTPATARGELIRRSLLEDRIDPEAGEIVPVVVVFNNGSCYHAAGFARHIAQCPELLHVRTPQGAGNQQRHRALPSVRQVRASLREHIDDVQQHADQIARCWPSGVGCLAKRALLRRRSLASWNCSSLTSAGTAIGVH